jgi:hypothetical protein
MANKYGYQFLYSYNPMLTFVEGNFVVGASGAVGTVKGSGIDSITKLSTGTYQIKLQEGYPRYLSGTAGAVAPTTGSAVNAGSFSVGTTYVIASVGSTDFAAAGMNSSLTADVGVPFVATAVGSGSGTALAVGDSGIVSVEVVGNPNLTVPSGIIIIQCMSDAGAVANPASGSVIGFTMMLRNSTLPGKGE